MKSVPVPMMRFDLLQFDPLFVGKIGGHLLVRLRESFMHAPASVRSYLVELGRCFIDYRRYFRDLFQRQIQLPPKMVAHPLAHHSPMMPFEEHMTRVRRSQKGACHSPGDEDEDEPNDQLPL
jgi:hypothetical protein